MNVTKKLWQSSGLFTGAVIALLATANPLHADEKTWTGVVDGSWLNGGNWSPSALVTDLDGVLYDSSSTANLSQTLDQGWSVAGIRVATVPGPVTILSGASSFTLTNTAGIDMTAATSDLTIQADYLPVNNGTLSVAAGRVLTLSNVLATINNATTGATVGAGTVRITGASQRLTPQLNAVTLIVDGGSVVGNPPVQLSADTGSTVTVLVTNNGSVNITSGNATRIHLGNLANSESTNHFILDGGNVNISGSANTSANGIFVGSAANTVGILDINNGTVDMTNKTNQDSVLRIGNSAGSLGIVNLNANGRLLTPRLDRVSGYAIFNFNGGYFQATVTGTYFDLVDEVHFLAGGAVIDTGTRIVTIGPSFSGTGGLTKLGTGSLILTGTNHTFTGPTIVSNGTFTVSLPLLSSSLFLGSNVAFNGTVGVVSNSPSTFSDITLQSSNTLTFTYGAESQPSSTLFNTTTLSAVGTNVINIGGAGWPAGTIRLIDYTGSIVGGGKFVLGTLPVGLNARLTNNTSTTSIDLVVSSGVNNLDWYGFNGSGGTGGGLWDIATTLNWNNGASVYNEYGTGTNQLGDTVRFTVAGNTTVEIATTVRPSSVLVTNPTATAYSFVGAGKISGPTSLIREGKGSLMISTTNDYTGGTFLKEGVLFLGADNALPTAGIVYVGSPGLGTTFTLNGFNQTIGGLVSTGSGSGTRRVLNNSGTHMTLTINVVAGQTNIYGHTMGNTGAASTDPANNFSLVKMGPGIQTFANNVGYAGTTTVAAGTLLYTGTGLFPFPGTITVQSGGTLGGSATIAPPIVVESGGRLEPGNMNIGTFTVTNTVTLQGEAFMQINRTNAPTADKLVANTINLGGALTVTNLGVALQAGDTFTLFTGALSGNFSSLNLPALTSGLGWNTNNLASGGVISVVSLPVPSFQTPILSGSDLILSGTGGSAGGTYYVLTSTNIGSPVSTWTTVATNSFDGTGAFNFTNAINPATPQQFYLLKLP